MWAWIFGPACRGGFARSSIYPSFEVVASAEVVSQFTRGETLIDIGGEDAKMIFFKPGQPDIRMNGSRAGERGLYRRNGDLLNVPVSELDQLASKHTMIYPMASRCGVFAKTDLQNLLSRDVPREDIAASVFHAVVLQTLSTLSRGYEPNPLILFSGGPLTFLPALKNAFMQKLNLGPSDIREVENAQLLPAIGAALANTTAKKTYRLNTLIELLKSLQTQTATIQNRLPALFESDQQYQDWKSVRTQQKIERVDFAKLNGDNLFLGVDSGSTTTKLVLIDAKGRVIFDHYANNRGNAIQAVQEGLKEIRDICPHWKIRQDMKSVVTGYGED
jgi:activator of 2-hydroxyglutaryl-CoA dehydratase